MNCQADVEQELRVPGCIFFSYTRLVTTRTRISKVSTPANPTQWPPWCYVALNTAVVDIEGRFQSVFGLRWYLHMGGKLGNCSQTSLSAFGGSLKAYKSCALQGTISAALVAIPYTTCSVCCA